MSVPSSHLSDTSAPTGPAPSSPSPGTVQETVDDARETVGSVREAVDGCDGLRVGV